MSKLAFEDAFNLLCGDKLGSGIHRDVFECRLMPQYVVKVEIEENWRYFGNVHEMKFWSDNKFYKKVADWLAPCDWLAPNGRILLQRRVRIATAADELPPVVPSFLTDLKPENFGFLDGKLVCVDYAMHLDNPNIRLKKAVWTRET